LLALIHKGAIRKVAYELVQNHAMAAWNNQGNFQTLIEQDSLIAKHLSKKEIASCFNPKAYVRHQQQIFKRVFGKSKPTMEARSSQRKRSSTSSPKG
jgi:adenylosuccinate lyase